MWTEIWRYICNGDLRYTVPKWQYGATYIFFLFYLLRKEVEPRNCDPYKNSLHVLKYRIVNKPMII